MNPDNELLLNLQSRIKSRYPKANVSIEDINEYMNSYYIPMCEAVEEVSTKLGISKSPLFGDTNREMSLFELCPQIVLYVYGRNPDKFDDSIREDLIKDITFLCKYRSSSPWYWIKNGFLVKDFDDITPRGESEISGVYLERFASEFFAEAKLRGESYVKFYSDNITKYNLNDKSRSNMLKWASELQ